MKSAIFLKIIFLAGICNSLLAMEEPPLVHIQRAEDATQFAGQIVAFAPISFIDDSLAYKESVSKTLNPALRYGYVTPNTIWDWQFFGKSQKETPQGHNVRLLLTSDVNYGCHVLLTRLLKEEKLLMRKITLTEAVRILQIIKENEAHFEDDCDKRIEELKQLVSKH